MLHEIVANKVFCLMLMLSAISFNANSVTYTSSVSSPVTSAPKGIMSNWSTGPPNSSGPSFVTPTTSSSDEDNVQFNAGGTHSGFSTLVHTLARLDL